MYQTLRYEKQENIGILTINRPEALNALNSTVIGDLEQAITEVEKDAELGALIITGEGRSFVAGADIGEQLPLDVAGGRKWGQRGSALMRRIEKLEGSHFEVTAGEGVVWNFDGERGLCGKVVVDVLPGKVNMIVPAKKKDF